MLFFFKKCLATINVLYRGVFISLGVLFVSIWLFINLALRNFFHFDTVSAGVELILIISACLIFYAESVRKNDMLYIYQESNFWITTAYFFYSSGSLFLILYVNTLSQEANKKEAADIYNIIIAIVTFTKNALITVAFLIKEPTPINQSSIQNVYYLTEDD